MLASAGCFPQIKGRIKTAVSFVLPDSWEVISTARPAKDGSYPVETKRPAPFYFGRAESARDDDTDLVSMAIEPGWPPAKELLVALRQQIRHRQRFGKRGGSRPVLAVFLSPKRPVPGKELLPSGVPQLLALTAPETPLTVSTVQQAMARGLARLYFPATASFSAALGTDRLIDYLALKALLKTGVLGKGEFLDALAVDLWGAFGEVGEVQPTPRSNVKTARTPVTVPPPRTRCSGLMLDLALSFYGDTLQSLDAFLARICCIWWNRLPKLTYARDFVRSRSGSDRVWQSEETQRISDLLNRSLLFASSRAACIRFPAEQKLLGCSTGRTH
jgi:hypothetical protein